MNIQYDVPIEVSKSQLEFLRAHLGGIFCWRFDGEKYWIKVWLMKYVSLIEKVLTEKP